MLSVHAVDAPIAHLFSTSRFVEVDRRLVPKEHLPLESLAVHVFGFLSESYEEFFA